MSSTTDLFIDFENTRRNNNAINNDICFFVDIFL